MKMILHGYLFYLLDSNQTLFAVHTLIIHCTLFFLELVQESLEQDFCLQLPSLVSLESIINMDIHIWIFGPWRTLRLFKCQEKKPEGNNVHVFYTKGVKGDKVEFVQEFNFKFYIKDMINFIIDNFSHIHYL